ncbi:MAG: ArsR/SmtB family transcription factor, partial [Nitrososphaerales archaeon]
VLSDTGGTTMRINDSKLRERLVVAVSDPLARKIVSSTISRAKSVNELAEELAISVRSVYRYIDDLNKLGLLTAERSVGLEGGGKYRSYRSMIRSIIIKYEGEVVEVELIPNEGIQGRFLRFWNYMSG